MTFLPLGGYAVQIRDIHARILMRKLNPGQYKLQSWTILALNHVIRESWTFYVAIPAQFKLDKACSSSIFSG